MLIVNGRAVVAARAPAPREEHLAILVGFDGFGFDVQGRTIDHTSTRAFVPAADRCAVPAGDCVYRLHTGATDDR